MEQILEKLASDWGALKFVTSFIILPFYYLKECIDIYKDIYEHNNATIDLLRSKHNNILFIFNLQWWLIFSVTAFLLGIFFLGDIANGSTLLTEDNKALAEGLLNLYCIILTFFAMYYVRHRKAEVYKTLTKIKHRF